MKSKLIDTNIIVRFLVEDVKENKHYKIIFDLFEQVEKKEILISIEPVVVAETFFVLTKFYEIPRDEVCRKLIDILGFSGVQITNKNVAIKVLERLMKKKIDFVDSYLIELALDRGMSIFTADKDLIKSEAETEKLY